MWIHACTQQSTGSYVVLQVDYRIDKLICDLEVEVYALTVPQPHPHITCTSPAHIPRIIYSLYLHVIVRWFSLFLAIQTSNITTFLSIDSYCLYSVISVSILVLFVRSFVLLLFAYSLVVTRMKSWKLQNYTNSRNRTILWTHSCTHALHIRYVRICVDIQSKIERIVNMADYSEKLLVYNTDIVWQYIVACSEK